MFKIHLFLPTTPPASAVNNHERYGYKKTWETSAAYPSRQAFALPMHRDKQLSQPTPMRIIMIVCRNRGSAKHSPHWHTGIIHPAWTPRCEIFMCIFKVAKFDDLKITCENVL